jgi:monovalent cation:H+ antiporter, CPA1 family
MSLFELAGLIFFVVALFGYLNGRFLRMPDTLGNMAIGLLASLAMLVLGFKNEAAHATASKVLAAVNFPDLMFHGMLGLLLFAGSLHVNVLKLRSQRIAIFLLASAGVLVSTAVVGLTFHYAMVLLDQDIPLVYCLMFGALISPTDPIAVMGVLKKAGVPESLSAKITGEALFNDGTAVVAFLLLLGLATGATQPTLASVGSLFAKEVGGGLVLGFVLGYGAILLLKGMDSYPVEIITTLAVATGGYALAERLHVSAPLAIVIAGLVVGNTGAKVAMSEKTRLHLFMFWELLDEVLNLVLFALIGLELLELSFEADSMIAGIVAIPLVLGARWVSVVVPLMAGPVRRRLTKHAVTVLTWGGLRGGISVALALSLPTFDGQPTVVMATYCVVVFSLLVQGTTLGPLIGRLGLSKDDASEPAPAGPPTEFAPDVP